MDDMRKAVKLGLFDKDIKEGKDYSDSQRERVVPVSGVRKCVLLLPCRHSPRAATAGLPTNHVA